MDTSDTSRRDFIKLVAAGTVAAILTDDVLAQADDAPPADGAKAPAKKVKKYAIPLAKAGALATVGGWTVLKLKSYEILFVRDSETTIKALDPYCTHQHCKVEYEPSNKQIACHCHESYFDLEGTPLSGPAKAPLLQYDATLKGDKIIVAIEQ